MSSTEARVKLQRIYDSGADVIFLAANTAEGQTFAQVLAELPEEQRLPVRSHLGNAGADVPELVSAEQAAALDIAFFQHASAGSLQGGDVRDSANFKQAYELTRLLITAANQVGLTGFGKTDRRKVRDALESLQTSPRDEPTTYEARAAQPPLNWIAGN